MAKNKAGLSSHARAHAQGTGTSLPPVPPPQFHPASDCPHCSLLPAGSVNITSMFIVMVFCLTAVLFIAMYKMNLQDAEIRALRTEMATYVSAQQK
jgi:hypothetical protein